MKQSDPLQLVDPGTLPPPGPIGRVVRLLIGVAFFRERLDTTRSDT